MSQTVKIAKYRLVRFETESFVRYSVPLQRRRLWYASSVVSGAVGRIERQLHSRHPKR